MRVSRELKPIDFYSPVGHLRKLNHVSFFEVSMEVETIFKFLGAVAAIIGAGRVIYEVTVGKKSRLREDYKFAKEFLNDLKVNPDLHPFAIEKGYQAIAGSTVLKSEEIAYLLSLENPGKCLKDYVLSKNYLQHLNTSGDLQLSFSEKYAAPWARKWRKAWYLTLYFGLAFASLSPLFFVERGITKPVQLLTLLAFTISIFGFYAWESLKSFARIYRGEKLVQNQSKHTRKILLST